MELLQDLPEYKELCEQYGEDLIGFISLLNGPDYTFTHSELYFLSCVKQPGSRLMDSRMHEFAPYIALWFFLFHPESMYLHIASENKMIKVFSHKISVLLNLLKSTKHAWILDFIIIKSNSLEIKRYRTWNIVIRSGNVSPTNLAGFFSINFMIWVEDHWNIPEKTIEVVKSALTQATHRFVLA